MVQKLDLLQIVQVAEPFVAVLAAILVPRPGLDPVRLMLISVAGWLGQQQPDAID